MSYTITQLSPTPTTPLPMTIGGAGAALLTLVQALARQAAREAFASAIEALAGPTAPEGGAHA